jgi:ParB family chromosome partitioning protein
MVKKVAARTAGISMDGFQARPKVFDGQTPAATAGSDRAALVDRPRDRPYTGVGSVMAAITREAEVSQELVGVQSQLGEARRQLEGFKDAVLVMALAPTSIRRSRWANRNLAEFLTPEFQALKAEIEQAGGNVQPIKVRVLSAEMGAGATPDAGAALGVFDSQTPGYEIVYGHRRHQACLELGLPVNAVVAQVMSDQELFAAMDRENRGRKNLSAWEQGRMYSDALKAGLFPSLRRLSDSLGVNLSDASRTVQLAKLPADVVAAFASPLDLQVRWAKPLADVLQKDPDTVLARARALAKKRADLSAGQIFDRLIGLAQPLAMTLTGVTVAGKQLATIKAGRQGRVVVEFEPGALPAERRQAFVSLVEAFLAQSV